jgi:hypothetical protein
MEIKSLNGEETFYWDSERQLLIVLLPNGDRQQWAYYDVILLLKLLEQDKVQLDLAHALEKAPKEIQREIGPWRSIQAA